MVAAGRVSVGVCCVVVCCRTLRLAMCLIVLVYAGVCVRGLLFVLLVKLLGFACCWCFLGVWVVMFVYFCVYVGFGWFRRLWNFLLGFYGWFVYRIVWILRISCGFGVVGLVLVCLLCVVCVLLG